MDRRSLLALTVIVLAGAGTYWMLAVWLIPGGPHWLGAFGAAVAAVGLMIAAGTCFEVLMQTAIVTFLVVMVFTGDPAPAVLQHLVLAWIAGAPGAVVVSLWPSGTEPTSPDAGESDAANYRIDELLEEPPDNEG